VAALRATPAALPTPQPGPAPAELSPRGRLHFVLNGGAGNQQDDALQQTLHQVLGAAGRPFTLLGLYPDLLEDREAFKQRYGRTRLVALLAGLVTAMQVHPRLSLRVQADGQAPHTVRVSTLFVGNNRLQRHWKVALDGEVTRLRPPLRFTVDERAPWLVQPAAGAAAVVG
jgi:hypothetical protein